MVQHYHVKLDADISMVQHYHVKLDAYISMVQHYHVKLDADISMVQNYHVKLDADISMVQHYHVKLDVDIITISSFDLIFFMIYQLNLNNQHFLNYYLKVLCLRFFFRLRYVNNKYIININKYKINGLLSIG
jgi:hypothetical protein